MLLRVPPGTRTKVGDQHPELRPPVPDVILADDPVSLKFDDAADGIADDRAAEVADVHLLGDVGAGIVDYHGLRWGCERGAETAVCDDRRELPRQPARAQADVDKPRSC